MKRVLALTVVVILAATSIVLAQQAAQATLRTPSGDKPVPTLHQNLMTFFSATDVITALGGTVTPDSHGFKVTLNNVNAAFGPDSRFAVVRDDLIEMPLPPIVVNGVAFVMSSEGPSVLYALDAANGRELWTSGRTITSPALRPALWAGIGQVHVATRDNIVYAFGFAMERD